MTEGSYEVAIIPADDLDGAHSVMRRTLADARRRYPAARLRADYTGGTKTMTAALVLAALEDDDIELQLVAGSRADLVRVAEGTQASVAAAVEGVRLRRAMRAHLTAWQRHAYGEAAAGCRSRATPACVQRWPARATSPLLSPRGTISTMPAPPAYCSTPMSPSPPSPCAIM